MILELYHSDPYAIEFEADVLDVADGWCRLSRTTFFPGGGGQPSDRGHLVEVDGKPDADPVAVTVARQDAGDRVWHQTGRDLAIGSRVRGCIDWPYRYGLMRQHTLMHVVNSVALLDHGAMITGVQLGPDRSRIDLRLPHFSRELIPLLERRVNEVTVRGLPVSSASIDEIEFRSRSDLVRTANVLPPVVGGLVRVVAIGDFDVQACGGTHVRSTAEIGRARLVRFENKGADNKRFYWELDPSPVTPAPSTPCRE